MSQCFYDDYLGFQWDLAGKTVVMRVITNSSRLPITGRLEGHIK